MNNEKYSVIDDTELVDFKNILREHEFLFEDFELNEVDNTESGALKSTEVRIKPITGEAIVTRKSNGVTRQYKAGNNTAWVVDFQKELSAGIFGES